MFADSLLDTRVSSHRGWTTLASFGLQGVALCGVMLLPLLYTQGLPQIFTANPYITMVSPPGAQPTPPVPRSVQQAQSNMSGIHVLQPSRVPNTIAHIDDHDAPPPIDFGRDAVLGATGVPSRLPGIFASTGGNRVVVLPPPPTVQHPPRLSHMMEGNLIYRVQPVYPPAARAARIQGPVVIHAVISKEGTIENLKVESGHPFLVKAALDAVAHWRYRPYVLNGEAVEVETQITVNFVLSGQ